MSQEHLAHYDALVEAGRHTEADIFRLAFIHELEAEAANARVREPVEHDGLASRAALLTDFFLEDSNPGWDARYFGS